MRVMKPAAIRRALLVAALTVLGQAAHPGLSAAAPCYLVSTVCGGVVVLGRCGGTGSFQADCLADPPSLICDVACLCVGERGEPLAADVCPALVLETPTLSPAGALALGIGLAMAGLAMLKLQTRRSARRQ